MTIKMSGRPLSLDDVRKLHSQTITLPGSTEVTVWSNGTRHDITVTDRRDS